MTRSETPLDPIAILPFLLFVAVADAEQSVGAAEANAFFRLLRERGWARSPALARALEEAAARYPDHWRLYLAGSMGKSVSSVMQAVVTAAGGLSQEDAGLLEGDLLYIAASLRKAGRRPKLPRVADRSRPFAALEAALRASAPVAATEENRSAPLTRPSKPITATGVARLQPALASQAPLWESVRTRLRCVSIKTETENVRTFHFASDPERLFSYKPGQFMTLDLEAAGRNVRRSYTISSPPSRPHLVAITVKRIPTGLVSSWLHDHLAVGDSLQAVIANGKFNSWDIPAEKMLLLSAGIGITPIMSMARWDFDLCIGVDTVLLHCARKPSDIVFRRELELLQRPTCKVIITCTRPGDEEWPGLRGHIDGPMIEAAVPDFRERAVFICGPESWMKSIREFFLAAGCSTERLHQEWFGPRSRKASTGDEMAACSLAPAGEAASFRRDLGQPAAVAGQARIVFSLSHIEVACSTDETILEVAERAGINIPSSCRVGSCGTCRVRKTSGVTKNEHCPGITQTEEAEGYVLTCSSTAEGLVVLDA